MQPFITFKDIDKNDIDIYYILQRDFPHYLGAICYQPMADSICCVPVAGHNLWITFMGTIRGNYVPSYPDAIKEIEIIFVSMANWFYVNRIQKEPKRYKKWAIQ